MSAYITPRQVEAYETFKKYASKYGRLPTLGELSKSLDCAFDGNAIYLAGILLLKGAFGHRVTLDNSIVDFGDFKFPMADSRPVAPVVESKPVPVSAPVAELQPSPASEYADAPVAIRNLISKAKVAKPVVEKRSEVMKRDIMNIMKYLKDAKVEIKLNSKLVADTLNESGTFYTVKQVGWAVRSLIDDKKLKGHTGGFTYL